MHLADVQGNRKKQRHTLGHTRRDVVSRDQTKTTGQSLATLQHRDVPLHQSNIMLLQAISIL
jgi:hypothetical protein